MVKFKEDDLVENEDLRNELLDRVDVLYKVGNIVTLSNSKVFNTKLVAEYYEVAPNTIKQLYNRNKKELDKNGVLTLRGGELQEFKGQLHDVTLLGSASAVTVFSARAVLNVGMLLTESEVAEKVRYEILNGYELLSYEQKTQSITDEQLLLLNIIQSDSVESRAVHLSEYNNFKNQHINQLNERIDEMKPKEEAFETFIKSDGYQTINQASKTLNIGRNKLYEFLRDSKVLMSDNTPYQRYVDQEYFVVKQNAIVKGNFSKIHPQTFITAKGIDYISKLLKKNKSQ